MHIADMPIAKPVDPQEAPQPIPFIENRVDDLDTAVADLTRVVNWLAVPELDGTEAAVALQRLRDFTKKVQG